MATDASVVQHPSRVGFKHKAVLSTIILSRIRETVSRESHKLQLLVRFQHPQPIKILSIQIQVLELTLPF
jgi:hypothetical protein